MLKYVLAAFAVVALAVPVTASASARSAARMTQPETALLRAMNDVRAQHGLRPLRADLHLERAARAHSREMLATGVFAHGAFAGRMAQYGVQGRIAGENLAWGVGAQGTAQGIVRAWLASPEHRANLLRPSFSRVGVADLLGAFEGYRGARVVTADFAG
jgi:uncharacterized protein YkwD